MTGIIISGQPRCGKSSLVKSFKGLNKALSCNVDGKFFKILDRNIQNHNSSNFTEVLETLITKKVYQDSNKQITKSISEEIGIPLTTISSELKKKKNSKYESILLDILDFACKKKKKNFWVLPDLGAEVYFERLFKFKKDLYVIFLYRNPLESIVSSLYWRSYPQKGSNLLELIVRWNNSYRNAQNLKDKFPKNVNIYFYHEIKKMKNSRDWFEKTFDTKISFKYNIHNTFFSYSNYKWLSPEGDNKVLLSKSEMKLILLGCNYKFKINFDEKFNVKDYVKILYIKLLGQVFLYLSKISPFYTLKIINIYFSPLNFLIAKIRFFSRLVKKKRG